MQNGLKKCLPDTAQELQQMQTGVAKQTRLCSSLVVLSYVYAS